MGKGFYDKLVTGDIINNLEVIGYSHTDKGNNRWLDILCYCGNRFKAAAFRIKSGHTKSCGCRRKDVCIERNINMTTIEKYVNHKKAWKTRRSNYGNS